MEKNIFDNLKRLRKIFKLYFIEHADFSRSFEDVYNEVRTKVSESSFTTTYTVFMCVDSLVDETYNHYKLIDEENKSNVDEYLSELYTRILNDILINLSVH